MRIAIANSYFPPWRGGAETYAFNLARALTERGHQVTVHCGSDPLAAGRGYEKGIEVVRHRILTRVYGTPVMPDLIKELGHSKVDLLHSNFPSPYIASIVALVSKTRHIPAVLTWHNDLPPVTAGARSLIEIHDRLILPKYITNYRRIISTSQQYAARSRILYRFRNAVRVVPNGVDCQRFHPSTSAGHVREGLNLGNRFTVIFVGALTRWHAYKGLDVLLKAVKEALDHEANIALVVVGDGELKDQYIGISRDLSLDKTVSFVGDIDDTLLPQYYAASNLLVLPSRDMSEGFGLTLLEANAAGKPVIASRVGGIPGVVRDGYNGILVPPNDPHALSAAMLKLIGDPRKVREMGRNGRKFAEAHDWKVTAAKTERVYEEALA
jgi:glycosyltransferase involved in cell wall biosynthesis